jgi:hypothetical protein
MNDGILTRPEWMCPHGHDTRTTGGCPDCKEPTHGTTDKGQHGRATERGTNLRPVDSDPPRPSASEGDRRKRKWRGYTAVYVNKAGERYAIFHMTPSGKEQWTHPYDARCEAC